MKGGPDEELSGWGWQSVFPGGSGQAQGTGFLVNSVQPALKILLP